ncbi:amidohydrolase [Paenibacillus sp. DS2015]|uniref:amidohydrolase n=1 Tax=Paenibacillus sp. DS2015 TaxID=3373917 RepID=UPI003D1CB7B8
MSKTIFTNGKIYTLDTNQPIVETIVVNNGKILDSGSTEDMILQWGRQESKIIDLQGKMVTPGMIDSHLHLSGVAFNILDLDLVGVSSKGEMLYKISEKAKVIPEGKWLIGMGWDENLFTDGSTIPTIQELNNAVPHCPIFLKRTCYHAFLVNSKALEVCHYHPSMEVPKGGKIVLDPVTSKPSGLILESASKLITDHIPDKSYDELKYGLEQAMRLTVESGLTSVHTNDPLYFGGLDQTYKLYDEVINDKQLGPRCNLLIDYVFLKNLQERGMYTGFGNERLQIGAIKMFADGAFGRRTALLSESYHDAPGHYGEAMQEQARLVEMCKEVRASGMAIAVHTIGDQALENVLDVLDQLPKGKYRDRIIHASLIRGELIKRLADPSRIADIQPRFVVSDYPWIQERLGEEREKNLYAWRTLLSSGVICAGGSDAPVEPFDPLLGVHAALTRRLPSQSHHAGWNEIEKLSISEAVKLFTIGGAYATNEEHIKGTLTRGKLADMTVFSHDLFTMEHPDELLSTNVEMTIIDGEVSYIK